MSKILVLAEKPSVARDIARVMNCHKKGNGCISGDKYIVTWALGHLVTLADPEHYGDEYKRWSIETLPMLPRRMDLEVIRETSKQYNAVKTLLNSKEIASVIIATDAGREGELVARWIIAKAGCKKPLKRLWISSQTDKAIREGFAALKDGSEYMNLYMSAQARAEADWLVGLNVTRALTCKFNAQLSAGRVQTPTLALIVQRENEIRSFRPKTYYTINADMGRFFVTYKDANNQSAVYDKEKAEKTASEIKGKKFRVNSVKETPKKVPAPMLYDLTELQRDANKLYGYSAKQTLSAMQRLYEQHKALTYPRTDSRYITDDIVPTLTERIKAVSAGEFAPFARELLTSKAKINAVCVNNKKVSDHHAIIPTEQRADLLSMSNEERRIYVLAVKRFLACFMPPYEYRSVSAELSCGDYRFTARGQEITALGWKRVYGGEYEEEEEAIEDMAQNLPSIRQGMEYPCKLVQLKEGKTKPPSHYTEAMLLSAMENPSKFVSDKSMKKYLGGGLGTPATRADIIEKLFNSFYIERRDKSIIPTSKGEQVVELAPPDLTEPLLTAKWEMELEKISRGEANKESFINEIKQYSTRLVRNVVSSTKEFTHDNLTKKVCPQCGKFLLDVNGKHGKMLVCQDRECGYRETVTRVTNARCPVCHKKMELFGTGEKKSFVCACGHRESEDQFVTRTKGSKNAASKAFTRQYLKNQNKKTENEESDFARALRLAMEGRK